MKAAVVLLLAVMALGLEFKLGPGMSKCLGEEVQRDEPIVLRATVAPDTAPDVQVTMYNPMGLDVFTRTQNTVRHVMTAAEPGEYRVCFNNFGAQEREVSLSLDIGLATKDYDAVAKKNNLKPLELELRRIEDIVRTTKNEMIYMRTREEEMRTTNESTSSRVLWFSVLSLSILGSLGIFQIIYLKRFFASKKMI